MSFSGNASTSSNYQVTFDLRGYEMTLQYLADEQGEITAVVVPIDAWREISSELETQYLLRNPAMRRRLLAALGREGGASLEEALSHLGVSEYELYEEPT